MLLVFVCITVRISQNLLNDVPVERPILADFANYHLNSLNGELKENLRLIIDLLDLILKGALRRNV